MSAEIRIDVLGRWRWQIPGHYTTPHFWDVSARTGQWWDTREMAVMDALRCGLTIDEDAAGS